MARHHYETLQQVFDDAYRGLHAQGFAQSLGAWSLSSNDCAYRGENGLRCAIGHCLPDDLYEESMEGENGCDVLAHRESDITDESVNDLQVVHDASDTPEAMKDGLDDYAERYGLTIPSVEEAA